MRGAWGVARGGWCVVGREPGTQDRGARIRREPGRCARCYGAAWRGDAARCGGAHHEEGESNAERLRERRVQLVKLAILLAILLGVQLGVQLDSSRVQLGKRLGTLGAIGHVE